MSVFTDEEREFLEGQRMGISPTRPGHAPLTEASNLPFYLKQVQATLKSAVKTAKNQEEEMAAHYMGTIARELAMGLKHIDGYEALAANLAKVGQSIMHKTKYTEDDD